MIWIGCCRLAGGGSRETGFFWLVVKLGCVRGSICVGGMVAVCVTWSVR